MELTSKYSVQLKVLMGLMALFLLITFSSNASAMDRNVMDTVLVRYQDAASAWSGVMLKYAKWLFMSLALISLVWTFLFLLLQGEGLTGVLAELLRFTAVTGFFFYILINGPAISMSIIKSMWDIGAEAIGQGSQFTPGGVTKIGFDIFFKVLDQSSVWSPVESTAGIILGLLILAILALVGVNLLLLYISSWVLVYGGIFYLGFGGSKWTSDMAIGFYKTVLSTGAQLMSMVLIIGIGKSILDTYYSGMSGGASLKEMSVIFVAALALLFLSNKIPALIGGIAGGGGTAGIGGFGAGALVGAAAGAAAIAATGGAMAAAGATQAAGGVSALQAAFEAANAAESGSGGSGGGSGSSGGEDTGNVDNAGPAGGGGSGGGSDGGSGGGSSKGGSSGFASSFSKAGRVMSNMASSLSSGAVAHGSSVANSKMQSARDAIAQTTGGQIASQIRAQTASRMSGGESTGQDTGSTTSQAAQEGATSESSNASDSFSGDSLSGSQNNSDTGNVQDTQDEFEQFKNKQAF